MAKTITIGGIDYYVFCTVDEADAYFAAKINSTVWDELSDENKAKLIIEATRKLNNLKYNGFPVALEQPLAFPRYFKINHLSKRTYTSEANAITVHGKSLIYIELPVEMLEAVCEQSVYIAEYNGLDGESVHIKNQRLGISSINIGAGSVTYNGSYSVDICSEALNAIGKYLMKTARVV